MGTNGNQKSTGTRARTRDLFAKPFKKKGAPNLTRYLKIYKLGDIVDIKCDPSVQTGMPYKYYQGKTGRVWNVTPRSVGVFVSKKVGHRFLLKKIHVRVEHVTHSTSRDDFLKRMKKNDELKAAAKARGGETTGHVIAFVCATVFVRPVVWLDSMSLSYASDSGVHCSGPL